MTPDQLFMNIDDAIVINNETKEELQQLFHDYLIKRGNYVVLENAATAPEEVFQEFRYKAFGASDASVLLGVAFNAPTIPMKTIEDLIIEKNEKFNDPAIGKKAAVRKGKELESLIIEKVETFLKGNIIKPQHMYGALNIFHTNFDGVLFQAFPSQPGVEYIAYLQPIPVEIKLCTMYGRKNYNWPLGISEFGNLEDLLTREVRIIPARPNMSVEEHINNNANNFGIPPYYYSQLQQQIYFTGAPFGYLAVMDDANWEVFLYKIPRDEFAINQLIFRGIKYVGKLADNHNQPQESQKRNDI